MATEPKSHETHQTQAQHHQSAPSAQEQKGKLDADKKKLAEEREARAKAQQDRESKKGTPTPTQEECDLLKLGHPVELANDGSGPDPTAPKPDDQHGKPYSHRQMGAAR
jgi:hypothetical protein